MVDLPRKISMQAFFDSYTKYILPEDILLLAVSGGVDSMVLLDLVLANHPRENIVVAHFDHSLRGVESDEDRLFIAKLCNKRNVHFEVEKMDISTLAQEEKMSIEMAARKYRYMFLHEIAEKYQAKYILTAHHLDDRIETAMFNLIRGSKLGGIHALGEVSWTETLDSKSTEYLNQRVVSDFSDPITNHQSPTTILRPLLHIPKSDIFDYARAHHIEYREDSTNTDTTYLRNYLRHMVLPWIRANQPWISPIDRELYRV